MTIDVDSPTCQKTAKALTWFRRAAYSGNATAVHMVETFPLQVPGMRVGVDGLSRSSVDTQLFYRDIDQCYTKGITIVSVSHTCTRTGL